MNWQEHIASVSESGKKQLAILLDPDKLVDSGMRQMVLRMINAAEVDMVFVGGSLIVDADYHATVEAIRKDCNKPVFLFPGSATQLTPHVDAVLLLSLISGRNADLLIGQHVLAAPQIRKWNLQTISTGYMLVDCGNPTTASYISATLPIPHNKPEIAAVTAMAGEMIGNRLIYLDGGSGAKVPVSPEMISRVKQSVRVPLIVGGGIRTYHDAQSAWDAGADILVIGTAVEENPDLLFDLCNARNHC
ncbi:MAG: geranylgeranylglyceryl/heptaprenylglyceryl phosphate synthase [Flavobacteriales bacterium]|nr:geranylgeranylglyceryl/heptaprenylglyceryl phosphate synthase [Flavobacteriales bacterium]